MGNCLITSWTRTGDFCLMGGMRRRSVAISIILLYQLTGSGAAVERLDHWMTVCPLLPAQPASLPAGPLWETRGHSPGPRPVCGDWRQSGDCADWRWGWDEVRRGRSAPSRQAPVGPARVSSVSAQLDLRLQTSTPALSQSLPGDRFRNTKKPVGDGPRHGRLGLNPSRAERKYLVENEKIIQFWAEWKSSWETEGREAGSFSKVQRVEWGLLNPSR